MKRIPRPSNIIVAKQTSPVINPVFTKAIDISIGVNVPIVCIPTTLRINTTNNIPIGKIDNHFKVFCCAIGRL